MKYFKKNKLVMLALMLVFVVSLAACQSNETGGKDWAQGVTEDTVTVGTIGVMAGPLSFIGLPYYQGMEAYFNAVNDDGGVNGRTIQLLKEDDQFDPAQAIAAAEKLIYDQKVFAIVGQLGTPGVMAVADIVEEEGIPSVYFGSGAAELTQLGDNFFPVQPNYVYEGKLMTKYAIEEFNAETIAILYSNDEAGNDGFKGVTAGLQELGESSRLVLQTAYNPGDTDFTGEMLRLREVDPDLVILFGLSGGVANILANAEEYNINVPMLTTYSNADASFLQLASDRAPEAVKNLHVMGWLDVDEASLQPLVDAMTKYFPEGNPYNAYTMAGWVAAETFVAGLTAAGNDLSWEGYINAMNNLKFTAGLAPEISYSPGKREGVTHMAVSRVVVDPQGNYIFEQVTGFDEF